MNQSAFFFPTVSNINILKTDTFSACWIKRTLIYFNTDTQYANFTLYWLIQTQKGSNERLFILTRTHSMQILRFTDWSKHKKVQTNAYLF